MNQKAQALLDELKKLYPECPVTYCHENSLHKFRIEQQKHPHWLFVDDDFVSDHNKKELITIFLNQKIPETLLDSPKSTWLFLGEAGMRKVDEHFGRNG